MTADEDYLAQEKEPEAPGKTFARYARGFAGGLTNPLGISGFILKSLAARGYGMTPGRADLFDRKTKEDMRAAPAMAGFGAGAPLGAIAGPAAIGLMGARAGLGLLPLSFMLQQGKTGPLMGMGAGAQLGNIFNPYEPPDAQAQYRTGGY